MSYQRVSTDERRRPAAEEPVSGMWRSRDMSLVRIHFERDNCRRDLLRIGKLGCVQFRDESDPGFRGNTEELRRADNLERQLRFFREQRDRWRPPAGWGGGDSRRAGAPAAAGAAPWHENPLALEQIEEQSSAAEAALRGHIAAFESLRHEWLEWHVRWHVLRNSLVRQLSHQGASGRPGDAEQHITGGALPSDRAHMFVRLHHRRSRGFSKLCPDPVEDGPDSVRPIRSPRDLGGTEADVLPARLTPAERDELMRDVLYNAESGAQEDYTVFVSVSFQPGLGRRIAALCSSMDFIVALDSSQSVRPGVNCRMPTSSEQHAACLREAKQRLEEVGSSLASTKQMIRDDLRRVGPHLTEWEQASCVHKAVALTVRLCRNRSLGAQGEDMWGSAWIPTARVREVSEAMSCHGPWTGVIQEQTEVPKDAVRPTSFPINKFTAVFQGIVDSYGAPRYKEINPTVFTLVTFPWLFGVMYGDIGHGLIIVFVAALLIMFERKLASATNEMFQMIFGARYLLLLMGLFATYVGFLYNDCFGIMLEYSPSRYIWPEHWQQINHHHHENATGRKAVEAIWPICWKDQGSCAKEMQPLLGPTPFGIDAAWQTANNKIDFYNSFKEKNAVILGISQMMLGLMLSFMNHRYFGKRSGDYKHIWFGFLPEAIFLSCTFGYMCVIIVLKWVSPWPNTNLAPNLLETMTNFFLSPGGGANLQFNSSLPGAPVPLYEGQAALQVFLLSIAGICVALMLFPIPYIEWKHHQAVSGKRRDSTGRREERDALLHEMEERGALPVGSPVEEHREPPVDMQEVVIKQVIHTIEFVLGSVSNTASYLRLWALSLAHAQLSDVFWEFAFMKPFEYNDGSVFGAAIVYMSFAVWLSVTLGVLVCMEALSAFLHALRLHWVEFQGKFYWADGVPFAPLDFAALLADNNLPPLC
eukprot:TRINITY_DN2850_c0_g2_i1.p1 TRINITY_DN2850_c0_g2~~TRINITY_DN2850_c0_g2_i1.p1  ORF type:complete len:928 (+),score=296.10 TRINITY_DN2850_c0_g2_i1:78-2861(+)